MVNCTFLQERDRRVNIGFGTQEVVEEERLARHQGQSMRPFGPVTEISLANCDRVTINMASLAGAESVPKLTIQNVSDLSLKFGSDDGKPVVQESGRPEPRNMPGNRGMSFHAKNVTISCGRNTFCGAGYDSIGKVFLTKIT